jgi:hypothetical protein
MRMSLAFTRWGHNVTENHDDACQRQEHSENASVRIKKPRDQGLIRVPTKKPFRSAVLIARTGSFLITADIPAQPLSFQPADALTEGAQ